MEGGSYRSLPQNVRRSLCVVCSEQRRSGATGSQIPARDIPTYDERDPPEEEKKQRAKTTKKRKKQGDSGRGFLVVGGQQKSGGFSFFSLWGKLIRFDD